MVTVDTGVATQVGAIVVVGTYLLRTFVPFLQKKDPRIIAILTGVATIITSAIATPLPTSAVLASGAVGVTAAGVTYDKVLKPVVETVIGWFHSLFPNAGK